MPKYIETFYPDGHIEPEFDTTYGLVEIGDKVNKPYRIIGIRFSDVFDVPAHCVRHLLSLNTTNQEGIINLHIINVGNQFQAYGDAIIRGNLNE